MGEHRAVATTKALGLVFHAAPAGFSVNRVAAGGVAVAHTTRCSSSGRSPQKYPTPDGSIQTRPSATSIWWKTSVTTTASRIEPGRLVVTCTKKWLVTSASVSDQSTPAELDQLVYVHGGERGLRRERRHGEWVILDPLGEPVADTETLERIRALRIPPAWTHVWIAGFPNAHLQATGLDSKGRRQYLYHPLWRVRRDHEKYDDMLEFAGKLPRIRATTKRPTRCAPWRARSDARSGDPIARHRLVQGRLGPLRSRQRPRWPHHAPARERDGARA